MAKYAILSDIHSNLEAFLVVLAKCREIAVDSYICLGDIVGYNADPVACLKKVRELNPQAIVRGNHDDLASGGDTALSGFNANAQAAIRWTREQLSEEERRWLGDLPMRATIKEGGFSLFTIVHATLDSPDKWGYVFDVHHAEDNFRYQFSPISFCGHSHVPVAFSRKPITTANEPMIEMIPGWIQNSMIPQADEDFSIADELTVPYQKDHKYLFNIGSIGQPRNGDPRASFVILDTDKHTVSRFRLPYDVQETQRKVLAAGLPRRLADRLAMGS